MPPMRKEEERISNMTTLLILLSLVIFVVYNIIMNHKFGLPSSLSATYYNLPNKFRWVFTIYMWAVALLLLPAWIEVCNSFGDWREYLRFLSFLTCALICFVGVAPNFRAFPMESKVHTISATTAAVTALLWCFICCWNIMYVPIGAALIVLGIAIYTKTLKSSKVYWLEMMAFGATYASVLVCSLLY